MAYRYDRDLEFLQYLESSDLNQLVDILVYDKDGEKRYTEELSESERYKLYYPDHAKYWEDIVEELQRFGGNSFVNIIRGGKGVLYKEILIDVCDKLKVNYNRNSNVERIETNLLMKILEDALEQMSDQERKELAKSIGLKNTQNFSAQTMTGIFQAIFRAGGFKSYQLTLIIVNAILKAIIGRGLSLAANATLTRTMAILTGPIGLVITGLWTAIDIAGPAYRVTIPAVIEISALRQKYLYADKVDEINFS
ncbi:DUF3944 domain-containing protein [Hydrogenimonas thermophila]|uniref:DUF3944 domain-containing protein n=1 Tax=Hydrogenimonas thermophila TaxID=223786 RepID=UPI002936E9CD|nr:DUF3944 domain-containing protein [Hydrogenimonas thermophila]WOE70983.1 DUF3944 domain-containing protein [Hydrogenimonas thermophila]WOE73501.1 DUF3944 domain-containing protein [Hydrogenimonas thermophila]